MSGSIAEFLGDHQECLLNGVAVVGAVWFAFFVLRNLSFWCNNLRAFVLPQLGIYKVDVAKYGSWASECGLSAARMRICT